MGNVGLKEYNSFLDFSVGGISLKINLSSVNKDLFFITPLTLQIGRMPLNLNILYSHNNQNEIENFGKGIRSSLYKRIEQLSDCCNVYNSDFSVDRYDIVDSYNYKNIETQNILYRDQSSYYAYRIKDKEDNKIEYEAGSSNYYKSIKIKGKAEYSITYPNNQIVYKNSFNDSLTLNIINNKVNTCYYRDSDSQDILFETNISYDNQDRLSGISVKKGNDYIRNETINYGSNSYEIIDNISGNKIVVTLNTSSILVEEYFLTNLIGTTTISYYINKTKVINSLGQELIYFFDNKGICVTTLNDNMAKGVIYHNDYKLPTFVSNEFRVEGADLNFLDLNDFITDVNKTAYSIDNIDINLQNKMIHPYMISGSGNTYSIVNRSGTSNDYLSFLLWVKVVSAEANSRFYIELMVNDVIKRIYINNLDISTTYRLISVGIRPTKNYNSVRMLIYIYNSTLIIGGLQLLNKGFGTAYTYDASGNLIEAQDKYGTTVYKYNNSNKIEEGSNYLGISNNISYNQNNQKVFERNSYGLCIENEYDSSNIHNLIKKTYETVTETFKNEYIYTNYKKLSKTKDEYDNETYYGYDSFFNVSSIMRLGVDLKEFNYNNHNLLSSIIRNPETHYEVSGYTYDEYKRITTITTSSNSVYSISYDIYNNISSVTLDGIILMSFLYDSNQMLEKIIYQNQDCYTISYSNNYKTVESISKNDEIIYEYTYDSELKLIGITNSNITKSYTYDNDTRIINQNINNTNNSLNIKYGYLNDELKTRTRTLNDTFSESYNAKGTNGGSNSTTLERYVKTNSNMFIAAFNNIIRLSDETKVEYCAINNSNIILPNFEQGLGNYDFLEMVGGINTYNPGKDGQFISYTTHQVINSEKYIAIGMWIRPNSITNSYVFMIRTGRLGTPVIYARLYNGVIKIYYESTNGIKTNIINSENLIENNKWNFIALRYYCDYIEDEEMDYGYNLYSFELFIGKKTYTYYTQNPEFNFNITTNLRYHIGYEMINGNVNYEFNGNITGIIMSNGSYVGSEFIKNYYVESYNLLIKNKTISSANEYGESTYYLGNSNYSIVDRIPLKGSFDSFDDKKPKCIDLKINGEYIESNFSFNEAKGCYAYTPKSLLAYEYNLGNSGSIILSFYVADSKNYGQILDIRNNEGRFGVYVSNKLLYIELFGTTYSTNITVTEDLWHKLGISFTYSGSTLTFRIFYDNYTDTKTKYLSNFSNPLTIYIGSYCSNGNALNLLFGQITDIILTNTYITQSAFNNIKNNYYGVSKSEYYDSLGRMIKEVINYDGYEALINTYTYDKTRVVSENLSGSSRSFGYNLRNYISTITDSTYGNHAYEYDDRGYLSSDNGTNYTYDGNGNILTAGNLSFVYDGTYKDRLNSVGGVNITYNSNNPYYPTSFGNISFTYEDNRLHTITISGKTITNYYDDEGIRCKKELTENNNTITTLYYYDNHKLLTEIENGTRKDYIYDSKGDMYGYVIGNQSYYFIKDSLGIIHGIKNSTGNIIQTYTYDAYGNITSSSGTLNNHIKYKGYYYDEEIGMYYLLSRYYNPYWRRFLTPDNYSYLDLEDINDLNLFAYCNNNPVMYSDGEGHSAILTLLAIMAGVLVSGAITGLGSAMGREDDESFFGAFVGGFIDGAVGSLAVALTAALPGFGGVIAGVGLSFLGGFVGNMVSQGISYGYDNIDYRASILQGGMSAFVNGLTGGALRFSGAINGATKLAKFIDASKISALGVAITGYLTYYSFPSANKIRMKKRMEDIYEM